MKQKNKSKRPKNLSRWVYFAHESDLSGAELFLGVNASYLQKVRANNRPVIYLHELNNPKYKWEVAIDLVEGFNLNPVKLTPIKSHEVYCILTAPSSRKKDYGAVGDIVSFGDARYSSLEDAVMTANKLAQLEESDFIFPN